MKYLIIILFFSFFYSCMPIHHYAVTNHHITNEPDTVRKSKLHYVYWHYKGEYKQMLESAYRDSIKNQKMLRRLKKQ